MDQERMEVFLGKYRETPPAYIVELERQALADEVPVIRRGTRDVLRYLLRTGRPAQVLEVGTAIGYSALCMKEYLPETSRITTIEKVEMRLVEARKNLKKFDSEGRITLLEGDAADVLRGLVEQGKSYDFIFMDAAKGQYPVVLPTVLGLLEKDGILISDNVLFDGEIIESRFAVTRRNRTIHKRMREYLYTLTHDEHLQTSVLPVGDGAAITVKR